jgi:hypothetical protein
VSWNFHGTLRLGAEDPAYHIEKARKRPRRQRVVAVMLVVFAGFCLVMAWVPTPAANTSATVTASRTDGTGRTILEVSYPGADDTTVTVDVLLPAGWSTTDHPVGSTLEVAASTTDVGGPRAEVPVLHPWTMLVLALGSCLGAAALWRAARRNDRRFVDGNVNHWKVFPGLGLGGRAAR